MSRPWLIVGMLFTASAISYIDRQTVSVVAPLISREFSLNNEQVGRILAAFLLAYTFGQLVAGRFLDWIGSRRGLAISIGLWSLANALTATVTRYAGFVFCRFLLGTGESGNFPGGVKVIAEWFPARERAFPGGVFVSGASVGAVLAGPLVGSIAYYWGWRTAFIATGLLGFVWLAGWLLVYRTPPQHAAVPAKSEHRWAGLLGLRQVWALTIARMIEEPVLWMGIFWLPKYLVDVRGLSVLETGWLLTLPFLALDLGYVSGGWLSSRLVRRGWSIRGSKLAIMICAATLMISSIPAAKAASVGAFAAFISFTMLGHGAWFSNALTMPADFAPAELVASAYGITALGGGLGGMIFTEVTGIIADRFHSFAPVFMAAGLMPVTATAVLILVGGKVREAAAISADVREHPSQQQEVR